MRKNLRLYNMILPMYLLMTFHPLLLLLSMAGNLIIDGLLLFVISLIVEKAMKNENVDFGMHTLFIVWGLGFFGDFIGAVWLFIGGQIGNHYIYYTPGLDRTSLKYQIMNGMNDVTHRVGTYTPFSIGFIVSGIIVAAIVIFCADFFIAFRKTGMTRPQRFFAALAFAVLTAPYTFLIPA